MNKIFLILVMFILISSCSEEKHKAVEIQSGNSVSIAPRDLKKSIMASGDSEAYRNLKIHYMDMENPEEIFFYSLVMANKFGNKQAFFDVYFYISHATSTNVRDIDSLSANMAIKYLIIASQKGHKQSRDIVAEYDIIYDEQKNCSQIVKLRSL